MSSRAGVTLPELLLASWLFALVLAATARFIAAQGALAATSHHRIRAADVARTVDLVLNGELRHVAALDVTVTADSVRLRAVRGVGVVCGGAGSELRVRYRGVRRPDAAKDSAVAVTGAATGGTAYAVTGVVSAEGGCGPGYRLSLDPAPPAATGLILVFETGSYHLSGGALRYRRGRGGRQPVTEQLLGGGTFQRRPGRIDARLALDPDSLSRIPHRRSTAVIRLLNPFPVP